MKNPLIYFALLFPLVLCAQKKIILSDQNSGSPILGALVYDCKAHFMGISNENGIISADSLCFPIRINHEEYKNTIVDTYTEEIHLLPNYLEIDEVIIQPKDPLTVYTQVVEKSQKNRTEHPRSMDGVYFETLVLIHENENDTTIINKNCRLSIVPIVEKKNWEYRFFCSSGEKSINHFKQSDSLIDSITIYQLLRILPKFDSNFDYDLGNLKKFQLDYTASQGKLYPADTSLVSFRKTNPRNNNSIIEHKALFKNDRLISWNKKIQSEAIDGFKINFDKTMKHIGFTEDGLQINSVIDLNIISFNFENARYKAYMVKGFIENKTETIPSTTEYKSVEDYLNQLPFSQSTTTYYSFF